MSALPVNSLPLAFRVPLEGTHLIEASAGSGKTWTLTAILARLLLERGLLPSEIVAVTFTRAATAELKSRVLGLLDAVASVLATGAPCADPAVSLLLASAAQAGVAPALVRQRLQVARLTLDEANIHTIHSFAQRVLTQTPLSSGASLEAELLNDVQPLLTSIAFDFWRVEITAATQLLAAFAQQQLVPTDAELQAVQSGELASPEALAKYLSDALRDVAGSDSSTALVGPPGTPSQAFAAVASATADERRAKQQLLRCFDLSGVSKVLADALAKKMLNGTSYKLATALGWLADTQAWLADAGPVCAKLKQLGRQALDEKMNKGFAAGSIKHAFFDEVDAYLPVQKALVAAWRRALAWLRRLALQYALHELPLQLAAQGARSNDGSVQQLAELARQATQAGASSPQDKARDWLAHLRGNFKACLLDEFQDTDLAQWTLFGHVFDTCAWPGVLLMVGDPKQAIYRFRGADLQAYLTARHSVGSSNIHCLLENFRSTPSLVAALNALFDGAPDFGSAEIAYQAVSAVRPLDALHEHALAVHQFDATGLIKLPMLEAAAATAARAITTLLNSGHKACDIAVLVGSHAEAAAMQAALRACGVASARTARESVFSSVEAAELVHLLQALDVASSLSAVRRAMPSRLLGYSLAEVAALAGVQTQAAVDVQQLLQSFAHWRAIAVQRGPSAALLAALHERGAAQRLVQLPLGERALTNLRHVIELLPVELHSAFDALRWLAAQRAEALDGASAAEQSQLRLESDHNTVAIMTIHAAKGLEFAVTVLPFMWTSKPTKDKADVTAVVDKRRVLVFDNECAELAAQAQQDAQAEARRLAYVALTRARDHCVLVWPSGELKGAQQASVSNSALNAILNGRNWAGLAAKTAADKSWVIYPVVAATDHLYAINLVAIEPPVLTANVASGNVAVAYVQSSYTSLQRGAGLATGLAAGAPVLASAQANQQLETHAADSCDRDLGERQQHEGILPSSSIGIGISDASNTSAGTLDMRRVFPRGSAAGVALHSWLELADFADQRTWVESTRSALRTVNFSAVAPELAQTAMVGWLQHVLDMPLVASGNSALRLRHISRAVQLREWPFVLAVKQGSAQLAATLQAVGLGGKGSLAPFIPQGYLNGVVDCIVQHAGRYYVIDYKSNWLGASLADYSAARVAAAVRASGYELQAAIYCAAVHLALQNTVAAYTPEQHFGGVIYVFLRGAERSAACDVAANGDDATLCHSRSGVWFHRPTATDLAALAALFTANSEQNGATP